MIRGLIIVVVAFAGFAACSTKAKYERMLTAELASGERYDSLFLGISLGMTDSAFYAHCYNLNQQELVYQGMQGLSVFYKMKELNYPASMNFYPKFIDRKIYKMPVTFDYDAWAPWNRELFSDSLQQDVLELMKLWYGDGFLEVKHPKKGSAYVKIDGNRQISVYRKDDRTVEVMITDLIVENEFKQDQENSVEKIR